MKSVDRFGQSEAKAVFITGQYLGAGTSQVRQRTGPALETVNKEQDDEMRLMIGRLMSEDVTEIQ